jgi:hypothetical protein
MAGKIDYQPPRPATMKSPGPQQTYKDLILEFPELADEINALVAPLDVGQWDRRSKAFDRMWPSMRPWI